MRCGNCGAELKDGDVFCPECGARMDEPDSDRTVILDDEEEAEEEVKAQEQPQAAASEPAPQPEDLYCPNCGMKLQAGDVFCDSCGYQLDGKGKKGKTGKKGGKLPLILGGAAAVAVVAVGGSFALKGLSSLGGGSGDTPKELLFVSDGSVFGVNLKKPDEKPVEYTDSFYESDEDDMGDVFRISFPTVSGKYRFIPEDYNPGDGTYTLCYQTGKEELEKIASGVQGYYVTGDHKVVYVKNNNLYVCEPGEKEEKVDSDLKVSRLVPDGRMLDSDMSGVWVSQDGKNLLWAVNTGDEDSADFYCQDIELKGEKVKLASDSTLVDRTENFESILFKKDDALYLSKGMEKAEKLVSGVEDVMSVDLEKETFFYTAKGEREAKLADYIADDMAEEDAQMKEPVRSDYERESGGYGLRSYSYTVVDDQYYDDLEKYQEKEERDKLREMIQEIDAIPISYTELYFYAEGQETLVTSDYSSSVASSDPSWDSLTDLSEKSKDFTSALLYKKEKPVEESGKKTKFSDLDSYDLQYRTKDNGDIEEVYIGYERVVGNQESETSYFLYSNGVDKELDLDGQTIQKSLYDSKNNQLVLLVADEEEAEVAVEGDRADSADDSDSTDRSDEKDEAGELMTVSLKGETAELVPYDEDVSFLELVYGGNIYYLKDVGENGEGDLYRNQESLMYDVRENGLWAVPDSKAVMALTDYDEDNQTGTLNLLRADSEEGEEIASDVYLDAIVFTAFGQDCIFMLSDYSFERGSGDLLYYDGKETTTLESDVAAYFAEYPGNDNAFYFSGGNTEVLLNSLVRNALNKAFGRTSAGAAETTAAASEAEEWASPETEAAYDYNWWY